jgi:hypothetical protein
MPSESEPAVVVRADAVEFLRSLADDSVDLVIGSPPYMDARTYGIDAVRDCEEWVAWMLEVTTEAVRVSKGLVLWVAAGVQRELVYWPGCEGLMWEWWKRGNALWRPCIWHKVDQNGGGTGIPGSGGRQWFRNDWEYVMAFKKAGWLPWADNTAMGHEPVCSEVGGQMSNRTADGRRINEEADFDGADDRRKTRGDPWGKKGRGNGVSGRRQNGEKMKGNGNPPSTNRRQNGDYKKTAAMSAPGGTDPEGLRPHTLRPIPAIANPGNFIAEPIEPGLIVRSRVGGGHMGHDLCHENEAPYPVKIPAFFVRSFCPPGGIVCDPFCGSGTTAHAALEHGRRFVGCDVRESQVELTLRRLRSGITPDLFAEAP